MALGTSKGGLREISHALLVETLERGQALLVDVLPALLPGEADEPSLRRLRRVEHLAAEICSECVPRAYAPHLSRWMDRAVALSSGLGAAACSPATGQVPSP